MFSYEDYQKIIALIQESKRGCSFREALGRDTFIIMRHDVEFSVERAYGLARLEREMGFTSSWFFQWTNNSYNLLSRQNRKMLEQMQEWGHTVGLHYATNGLTGAKENLRQLEKEIRLLGEMLGTPITEFSIHRPTAELLRANYKLPGILNAYQDEFFSFAEQVTKDTPLAVRYFSDARHCWNYGLTPDKETLALYPKIQILTHPYTWTPSGWDNEGNFRSLLEEKRETLMDTIDQECKHFAQVRERM